MNETSSRSHHEIGVACGLAAGAWLGMAEAPAKLVNAGLSPFLVSLGMVAGVFVARWTVPLVLKGTGYLLRDIRERPHLIAWAVLAGALWAVANTLTVFAIREVGLSIAFPLWNTNSLIGLFWGWLLFGELRGSHQWGRVLGGSLAIAAGAYLLAYATSLHANAPGRNPALGIAAALGAGLLWGTMYIPYRKAYISGMNPLSFVTIFTFGELGSVLALATAFGGGLGHVRSGLAHAKPALFWLFLGGFCWVIGDLFQQYAARYIGIGRGIPLSNTNQLWGLAWGVLVFGENAGMNRTGRLLVVAGSLVMAAGAAAIGSAETPKAERESWDRAAERESERYGLKISTKGESATGRSRWDLFILAAASGIFVYLASVAKSQPLSIDGGWMALLIALALGFLIGAGLLLWRRTRFN